MTAVNPSSFPDLLECTSLDPVLRGQYKLLPSSGSNSHLSFVQQPSNHLLYVYTRVGTKSVYLVYCEGVPELLPADIWETVIADALSRNAAANMSVAMRESVSDVVCKEVCREIMRIATEVSKELVGWLIVSAGTSHMVPLARCIQRLPDPGFTESFTQSNPVGISSAFWEVRDAARGKRTAPEWISSGLDAGWVALVTQTGLFQKEEKFNLRPVSQGCAPVTKPVPLSAVRRMASSRMPTVFEAPAELTGRQGIIRSAGVVEHVGPQRFVWNLIGSSSALDKITRDAHGLESVAFATEDGQRFTIDLLPFNESGLVAVTLHRQIKGSVSCESVSFKITLGGGQSGVKVMSSEKNEFTIVLDPRAVFGTNKAPSKIERAVMLAVLSLTVEFVSEK
jgi:hypothetical protein